MKKIFFLMLMVLIILTPITTQTIICFDESNSPFMFAGNLNPEGIYPEIVKTIFSRIKEDVILKALPWKRVIAGIESGENGVGGLYSNSDRLKKYDYSNPIFKEKMALYTLKEKEFKYNNIKSLEGKIVGVHSGWTYGDDFDAAVLKKEITSEAVISDEVNLKKLNADRIDVIIGAPEAIDSLIIKLGLTGKVVKLPDLFSTVNTYIAFNKKSNKLDLLKKINLVIGIMEKDGTIKNIAEKEMKKYN